MRRRTGTAISLAAAFLGLASAQEESSHADFHAIEQSIEAGDLEGASRAIADWKKSPSPGPETRAKILNLEGTLEFTKVNTEASLAAFSEALKLEISAPLRTDLLYNAALVAGLSDQTEAYQSYSTQLSEAAGPNSNLPGDLALERGLTEASRSSALAFETLENFLHRFPDHPRVADAEISLAELYLIQVPPQPVAARDHIDAARARQLTLSQREWLDDVAIWVEVAAQDPTAAIQRSDQFLEDWPQSKRRPEVLMVLGENHFRIEDYANAMMQFEQVATEFPDSPLAETGLFFAAKSASLTLLSENQNKAIALWTVVADRGGPLAAPARHEIGLLELNRDDFDAAIAAFDVVAAYPGTDPQLRIAALADRGEALFAKSSAAANDPITLQAAQEAFAQIQADPAATKSWRLQAALWEGKCLEALGRTDDAMKLYASVLQDSIPAGPVAAVPVAEFDWYFRAGLAAIRLLQRQDKWREAVEIADQVAQTGGPRATEAAQIGEKLRLRHFIWQDPAN